MIYAVADVEDHPSLRVALIVVDAEGVTRSIGETFEGHNYDGVPVHIWAPFPMTNKARTLVKSAMRGLTSGMHFLKAEWPAEADTRV